MAVRVVGVDPGKHGALAVLEGDMAFGVPLADMTAAIFCEYTQQALVVVERVGARPGQGVTSMFTFGEGFGRLLGWCEAMMLRHVLVTPQTWMKAMHRGTGAGEPKARSLEACRRLFPSVRLTHGTSRSTRPHDGIVDALLIAEWGRINYGPGETDRRRHSEDDGLAGSSDEAGVAADCDPS